MQARPDDLIRGGVAGNEADVVRFHQVGLVCKADGEGTLLPQVGGGLVALGDVQLHVDAADQTAPTDVHGVGGPVFVIGADHQHRLGIKPDVLKILSHVLCLLLK